MKDRSASAVVAVLCLLSSTEAFAYLDPGTGSYFLQLFLATVLGALYALKVYWQRIKGFLARTPRPPAPQQPTPPKDE